MSENLMAAEASPEVGSTVTSNGYLPPMERRGVRPCYADGLTTVKTYLVVAVNREMPQYNALGVRRLSDDNYKLHFWPNVRAFGDREDFSHLGLYSRGSGKCPPYEGGYATRAQLQALMELLRKDDRMDVAPEQHVLGVLQRGFNSQEHATV